MKTNRRNFIKAAGMAGTGVVAGGIASCAQKGTSAKEIKPTIWDISEDKGAQVFNMSGYAAPKLDVVRVWYIGIGVRGMAAVKRMALLEVVEIKAVADLHMDREKEAQNYLKERGMPEPTGYADGSQELWKELCDKEELDLIYIATPSDLHPSMCVYAMESGAHAATEIPAARTLDECWQLVETSEKTKKHCSMI